MEFGSPNELENLTTVKEGGLDGSVEKMRNQIASLTAMIDQIAILQKVPHNYKNLGAADSRELPALDQFVEYRDQYEEMQQQSEASLSVAYQAIMNQLSLLRDHTGVLTEEDAYKFEKVKIFENRIQEIKDTLVNQGYDRDLELEFVKLWKDTPDGVSDATDHNIDEIRNLLWSKGAEKE